MNTRSAQKTNVLLAPVSLVVRAIGCIRHFPELCDAWYKADDVVIILTKIFTLSESQARLLTPGALKREIDHDSTTASVDTAPPNEIGVYRRRITKIGGKSVMYFYYISSQHGIAPPSTFSNEWKHHVRSLVLPKHLVWPQGQEQQFEQSRQRLHDFLESKAKPRPVPPLKKDKGIGTTKKQRIESAADLLCELEVRELSGDFSGEIVTSLAVVKSIIQLVESKLGADKAIEK
jgi:hypothetical protein